MKSIKKSWDIFFTLNRSRLPPEAFDVNRVTHCSHWTFKSRALLFCSSSHGNADTSDIYHVATSTFESGAEGTLHVGHDQVSGVGTDVRMGT